MRTIKSLTQNTEKVFVSCTTQKAAMQFLLNAEKEGIRFANGTSPTQGNISHCYCLHNDGTLWYVGWAGQMYYHQNEARLTKVDFDKYASGADDYFIHRPQLS